jgi:polygalacturonase
MTKFILVNILLLALLTISNTLTVKQNKQQQSSSISYKNLNWLNVTSFGVKPDGVTNNTIKLQEAINFAAKNNQTLYFPAGIYLTNAITITSNLSIIGEGENTVLKAISPKAVNYKFGCLLYSWYNSNYKNISIQNITLDGNASLVDTSLKAAIANFSSCNNIYINNVKFINGQSVGIALEKSESITIENCTFDNFGWSALMAIGIKNAQLIGNKTSGWSKINLDKNPAWSFPSLSSSNVFISNNFFFNSSFATEYGIELYGAYSYNFNITNNIFDANGYKGSGISGAFKFSSITNNKFLNGTGNQRCGLEVHLDTSIVSNNIIQNGSIASFPFPIIAHHQSGGVIKNNIITNHLNQGYAMMIAGSSALDTTYHFEISDNTIHVNNLVNSAIIIGWYGAKGNYKDLAVYNNKINAPLNTYGIRLHGYSGKNVSIYNNYINGSISGISNDEGSAITGFFDIYNNTVLNSATKMAYKTSSTATTNNNRVNVGTEIYFNNNINKEPNLFKETFFFSTNKNAPKRKNAAGIKGEIRITKSYIYICIDDNKWIKTKLHKW